MAVETVYETAIDATASERSVDVRRLVHANPRTYGEHLINAQIDAALFEMWSGLFWTALAVIGVVALVAISVK